MPTEQASPDTARPLATVAGKFAVVGVLNTVVYSVVTVALVELLSIDPVTASVIGFLAAVTTSFILNTWWTFQRSDQLHVRFLRFSLVSVSAMLLNVVIMYLIVDGLTLHYLWGMAAVLLVIPPYNFVLNLRWSYR